MGQQRTHWVKNVLVIHNHQVSLSKIMIVKKVNFQAAILVVSIWVSIVYIIGLSALTNLIS